MSNPESDGDGLADRGQQIPASELCDLCDERRAVVEGVTTMNGTPIFKAQACIRCASEVNDD